MTTNAPDSVILINTATVGASDTSGTIDNVNITDSPELSTVTRFIVPEGQNWILEDLYISTSGDAGTSDPVVRVFKGGGRIMGTTPPLSNLLISNNSRPPYSNVKFMFMGGESLSMQTITTTDNDASADSIKFFIRVRVV
tara:strand:- start:480 stop:899 length:420 start_codon:yes stop_codon:yes gene_type:complete